MGENRNPSCAIPKLLHKLTINIRNDLLRAAPLHKALEGLGKHWTGSAGTASEYMVSKTCESIGDFISHDWKTPRISKVLTLWWIYNFRAALAISSMFGIVLSILQAEHVGIVPMPNVTRKFADGVESRPGVWCSFCCPVIFVVSFIFWQPIKGRCVGDHMVFVDKLCIHQTDDQLKAEGILALAAFLKSSKRMVILWSSRYFTRLWCTYELATWLHLGRGFQETVHFVPVELATGYCWALAFNLLIWTSGHILAVYTAENDLRLALLLSLLSFYYIGLVVAFRRTGRDLVALDVQLSSFSIVDSCCFCCTNGHKHPETGATLPCDRELVYKTLKDWDLTGDGTASESPTDHLDAYNEAVREQLKLAMGPLSKASLPYWQIVALLIPHLWSCLDLWIGVWVVDARAAALLVTGDVFRFLVLWPSIHIIVLKLGARFPSTVSSGCATQLMDFLKSLLFAFGLQVYYWFGEIATSFSLSLSMEMNTTMPALLWFAVTYGSIFLYFTWNTCRIGLRKYLSYFTGADAVPQERVDDLVGEAAESGSVSDLVARSSMQKSSCATDLIEAVASADNPVFVEMEPDGTINQVKATPVPELILSAK